MSMALMIWVGSIIIMPRGIDSIFAINNDMLSAAPVQDIITPKILVIMPVPETKRRPCLFV